mgnify:CR=1 FL=1
MATNKLTERVLNYLKEQEKPVTKTQTIQDCGISEQSVNDCLATLGRFNLIELWTNGRTALVKAVQEVQEQHILYWQNFLVTKRWPH